MPLSFQGKVQKLKDRQFGRVQLFVPHKNPLAAIGNVLMAGYNVRTHETHIYKLPPRYCRVTHQALQAPQLGQGLPGRHLLLGPRPSARRPDDFHI